ncbi:MAG: TonB-dependent receptor [Proteobacteria bacterium]|nr:TonB-dependent receptor [Pseudomonadota bacterium]MBU1386440.1 TonB-dependent receptor [Pseudomonadota bacterium]MBU1544551.1 TonB-dependent receptor [Pseudomonadota bacterium]MBU2481001.1 TonB-dependent receptor [Pseudomonadota bacterium]
MSDRYKIHFHFITLILLTVVLFQGHAWAAESSKVLKIEGITVKGASNKISQPPPSATIISEDQLQNQFLDKPLYMMEKIPGVAITDYSQGAVASAFTMRGLKLGHNTGVAIFLDGVPLNESTSHGDGYGDFNAVIPEDIAYVEVIKGPSSALYGQFARAGVVNIVTKRRGDFNHMKFGFGSWDRQRFNLSMGRENDKLSTVLGANIISQAGRTDNSDLLQGNVTGKFTYDFSEDLTGSLALNFYAVDWDHPEYLTQAQWDAGDYWSANPSGGGSRDRYGFNTNWTYDVTDDDFINFMAYAYRSNLTRYRDQITRVDEEYHDRDVFGGSTSYIWGSKIGGMENNLTLGLDGQVELTHTIKAQNPSRTRNAREILTVNGDSTLITWSLFFQNQLDLTDAWKVTLGGRWDYMTGELDDKLAGSSRDMEDFSVFSPKAGIEFTPLAGYTLFTTYGEGFKLPNGFDKFAYPNLKEETYTQYELGLKFTALPTLQATLTAFVLDAEDEILTDAAAGTKVNTGETRRKGIELSVDYTVLDYLGLYGTLSYTEGKYKNYISNGTDYSGTDIELVPNWIYSVGAEWRPPQGFFAGFDTRFVGEGEKDKYAVGYTGVRQKSIDYLVTDVKLGYQYKNYTITLDVTNVFDERYPAYETATSYRTANPLGCFLSFSMTY